MSEDWTPTEATRKQKMLVRIDPTFYAAPKNRRGKGLDGFRAGSHATLQVGFDRKEMRALPPLQQVPTVVSLTRDAHVRSQASARGCGKKPWSGEP
ncbi:hypothetical protein CYMTET_16382 [Cymbomonas tetramitiformis]|uniref:Uncharacterized protein n=1 Tax=Cymbomonas tetramitiformis TaxID=36881 RepID=A0AAE0L8B5_9CHLO|nr:hypothetical protein CYMTET_16382 [Cymbomonas tetramitiformis]